MAVSITGKSGSSAHNGTLTITGSGFGTKSVAAPVVWDNCSESKITALWSGVWPSAGTAQYLMQYRDAPYRGIAPPHSRVGRYMTGCHGDNNGADEGWNVMCWKQRVISAFPAYSYASWYQRCDDAWVFGLSGTPDDNFKVYDYSRGTSPYDLPNNWYTEYNTRPTSKTAIPAWHVNDDNGSLDGSGEWGKNAVNPMSGVWSKVEHYIKITNVAKGGFIKIYENGSLVLDMAATRTDAMSGTSRVDAIGGFSRDSGNGNNFRYFADLYLDDTLQHIVLGDASMIDLCSKLEVQKPTAWSDTSITVTVNRGVFSDGQKVYLYVYDTTGTPNTNGLLIAGADTTPPAPPKNLRIQ